MISALKPLVEKYPRLSAIYRSIRDQSDIFRKPTMTPWGFWLAGNESMANGSFEPMETSLIRRLLESSDTFINIGANVGYYCCHALSMERSVIAFEPVYRNLSYLYANVRRNGWSAKIEVFPIALSNQVGIVDIYGGNTGASLVKGWAAIPEGYVTLVPCSTADIVLGMRMQGMRILILVDVEGSEKQVLDGATALLDNNPAPTWIVEIATTEHQPDGIDTNPQFVETFELFFRHGYQAFELPLGDSALSINDVLDIYKGDRSGRGNNWLFSKIDINEYIS